MKRQVRVAWHVLGYWPWICVEFRNKTMKRRQLHQFWSSWLVGGVEEVGLLQWAVANCWCLV